jgi:hypothetical protein
VGRGWCFLIDSASYVAVVASLLAMQSPSKRDGSARAPWPRSYARGFATPAGFAPIRAVLMLLALVSLMGVPYMVLMPVIATEVLHGGPHTLGFLMAASGLGALTGTLYLASRQTVLGLGRIVLSAAGGLRSCARSRSRCRAPCGSRSC